MPKIAYINKRFSAESLSVIRQANQICRQYEAQGFTLTLRQLYYQFVSRGLIANKDTEYKRLGSIINDARLAGYLDWHHVEDRTRNLRSQSHWATPAAIMRSAAASFRIDKWATQPVRPEVWIEKDALVGVIQGICTDLDVPYFSCRGYTSQSEVWRAAQRFERWTHNRQRPTIIHLGDHDPSGIDMTRDITDRLTTFMGGIPVNRIALNMHQIQQYDPPPNPAKITDSRAVGYIQRYGRESWELDALEPAVIVDLIRQTVTGLRDESAWQVAVDRENQERDRLDRIADQWDDVIAFVDEDHDD